MRIEAEHKQTKANRELEGTSRTFKGLEGVHALYANIRQRLMTGMEDSMVKKHRTSVTPSEQPLTEQGHTQLLLTNKIYPH